MSMLDWFPKSVEEHKAEWILLAVILYLVYGNWEKGKDIRLLCELTGPHDYLAGHSLAAKEEFNNTCGKYDPVDE